MKKKLVLLLVPFLLSSCSFLKQKKSSSVQETSLSNSSETTVSNSEELSSEELSSAAASESETVSESVEVSSLEDSSIEQSSETVIESSDNSSEDVSSEEESTNSSEISSEQSSSEEEEIVKSISFPHSKYDVQVGKKTNLNVVFNPELDYGIYEKYMDGVYASSDTSVAEVTQYGVVTAKKEGKAVITFTTNEEHKVAACTFYVWNSLDNIERQFIRVDDVDTIDVGDELILACPDFGMAASINIKSGYIVPVSCTFSGNRITSYDEDTALYYVGPSDESDVLTLETQTAEYLAGKDTTVGPGLLYSANGKAQKNWIFEKPEGYDEYFCVNYDLEDDYWLMFNKINDSDIRLNLYDSNEQTLMKKPIIYRNTIVR